MKCDVCESEQLELIKKKDFEGHEIEEFKCQNCGNVIDVVR